MKLIIFISFLFVYVNASFVNLQIDTKQECTKLVPFVTCPCGKNDHVNITIEMCAHDIDSSESDVQICKPCNAEMLEKDLCRRYKNCETCSSKMAKCLSCPVGATGDFCTDVDDSSNFSSFNPIWENEIMQDVDNISTITIPQKSNVLSRKKRDKTGCPLPYNKLSTAYVHCTVYDYKIVCDQTCVWGYTLNGEPSGPQTTKLDCTYRRKAWKPHDFQDCIRARNCALDLHRPGSILCHYLILGKPDSCNITCAEGDLEDGEYATPPKVYNCQEDGSYSPPIPHCVLKVRNWPENVQSVNDRSRRGNYPSDEVSGYNGDPGYNI